MTDDLFIFFLITWIILPYLGDSHGHNAVSVHISSFSNIERRGLHAAD